MGNVGIKFKEFVFIYNFTCFKLMQMYLKSHGKGRNKKRLFNFLHKTNFNASLQKSNSVNWTNIIYPHINIYIYIYARPHVRKYEVLSSGTLYDILLI